jgi:hypothetical protein
LEDASHRIGLLQYNLSTQQSILDMHVSPSCAFTELPNQHALYIGTLESNAYIYKFNK